MMSLSELKIFVLSNKSNLVYSSLILINSFAYGINANILGATLDDLRFVYDASLDTMSNVALSTAIGYLLGALVGWLYKWMNRQLALTFSITMLAVSIAFVPFYGKLWIALIFLVLNGIGDGAWDASSGYWIVEMWPVGNPAMLQLMQFMYGTGAVVAPLLAAPYIQGEMTTYEDGSNITATDRIHALTFPFALTGIIQSFVPICLIVLFFTNRYTYTAPNSNAIEEVKKDIEFHEKNAPKPILESVEQVVPHRIWKLILCGVCFSAYASAELSWFNFSSAMYQNLEESDLLADEAAHVLAIMFVTYALGRLATAFITMKLSPDIIITYHFTIIFISFIFQFIERSNLTLITIANAVLGYGFSAMTPGILAFTERHLQLSDRICSLYSFGMGVCSLIIPLVMGQTFDEHPILLFFLVGSFISISLVCFIGVWFWMTFDKAKKDLK